MAKKNNLLVASSQHTQGHNLTFYFDIVIRHMIGTTDNG